MTKKTSYRDAGVDIDAANEATQQVKEIARQAQGQEVLTGIGAFGGLFQPVLKDYTEPVLVSSADGIGTKVLLAHAARKYNTLGFDIVIHCVNDILVMGADPLFFLDYLAFGKFSAQVMIAIVKSIAEACQRNRCSLLGGETAEMPDLYRTGDFDIAGFIVGMVDKKNIIDGRSISIGDVLIGVFSQGLHTNGYSLVRKIFFEHDYSRLQERFQDQEGPLGDALLHPHTSYYPLVKALKNYPLKGMAHITGGGIAGNLSRILPAFCQASINWGTWPVPPLFEYIQQKGSVSLAEMQKVFNMGLGLILVVDRHVSEEILTIVQKQSPGGTIIGEIVAGQGEVSFVR